MRSFIAFLLALICATDVFATELTVCAKAKGHPKHYVDKHGVPKGYAIDIAAEAIRRSGFDVQIWNYPWERAQRSARDGRCVITAFSMTEERKAHYYFSAPMFIDRVLLWQLKDKPFTFVQYSDLIGKRIGIPFASHYSGGFEEIRQQLDLFEDTDRRVSFTMLLDGRLDGVVYPGDIAAVKHLAIEQGFDFSELTLSQKPIALDPNHIGVPKNLVGFPAVDVMKKLNAALTSMKADGTVENMLERYR
jgi:ABC-type amino acid transport substrate-binding protein